MYKSESRIMVLNCGASAAGQVLRQAEKFGLTRDGYAWIVSDGVTGNFVSMGLGEFLILVFMRMRMFRWHGTFSILSWEIIFCMEIRNVTDFATCMKLIDGNVTVTRLKTLLLGIFK